MQSHHCLSHYDKCFPSGSIKNYVFFQSWLIKARLHGNDLSNIVILRAQRDKSVLGVICVFFELIGNFQNVNGNFQK
jgi:hypothetical protein